MVRVLVVSSLRIYREGVAEGLTVTGRYEATAVTPEGAVDGLRSDVVVYDVGAAESLESVRALVDRWPGVPIVVLGVEQGEEVVPWAEAGASGFVGRDASMAALCRVVEAAAQGELLCTPGVAAALCRRLASLAQPGNSGLAELTLREREVARLMEQGLTNKEIAARLCIQTATVKNHVHSILAKLGASRRGEAAARLRLRRPDVHGPSPRESRLPLRDVGVF
jgi:DNA-binding NarL/FixJ family response regulator